MSKAQGLGIDSDLGGSIHWEVPAGDYRWGALPGATVDVVPRFERERVKRSVREVVWDDAFPAQLSGVIRLAPEAPQALTVRGYLLEGVAGEVVADEASGPVTATLYSKMLYETSRPLAGVWLLQEERRAICVGSHAFRFVGVRPGKKLLVCNWRNANDVYDIRRIFDVHDDEWVDLGRLSPRASELEIEMVDVPFGAIVIVESTRLRSKETDAHYRYMGEVRGRHLRVHGVPDGDYRIAIVDGGRQVTGAVVIEAKAKIKLGWQRNEPPQGENDGLRVWIRGALGKWKVRMLLQSSETRESNADADSRGCLIVHRPDPGAESGLVAICAVGATKDLAKTIGYSLIAEGAQDVGLQVGPPAGLTCHVGGEYSSGIVRLITPGLRGGLWSQAVRDGKVVFPCLPGDVEFDVMTGSGAELPQRIRTPMPGANGIVSVTGYR
jgi:hypothetical protein